MKVRTTTSRESLRLQQNVVHKSAEDPRDASAIKKYQQSGELERKVRRVDNKEKKAMASLNPTVESSSSKPPLLDEAARKEAREFMRRQREKRKLETTKKEVDKSFVIKQRLDELRKTTRNVITMKTSKKNKSQIKISPPRDFTSFNYRDMKEIKVLKLKPLSKKSTKIPPPRSPPMPDPVLKESFEISPEKHETTQSPLLTPSPVKKLPPSTAFIKQSSPAKKAWGGPIIKPSSPIKKPKAPLQLQNQVPAARSQISLKPARPASSKENQKPLDDMKLKVPDVKLSMSVLNKTELGTSAYQSFVQPNSTVPFWLQNSGVQPYPYNFIWAVRKKLEAHTNAMEAMKAKTRNQTVMETPHLRKQRNTRKGRKLPDFSSRHRDDDTAQDLQRPTITDESETNVTSIDQEMASGANTISEISSIMSDLALVKSKSQERDQKTDDDDTTISESIFHSLKDDVFVGKNRESVNSEYSRSSFEKNLVALAPENVSPNTTAKKNNFLSSTMKNIVVEVPALKSPSALAPRNFAVDLDNNKINQEKEREYQKMLEAFQQSLSHVIEVNHKLATVLSSKSSVTSSQSGTVKNYSSSFENNVESEVPKTSGDSKISEIIENLMKRSQLPPPPAEPHSESNSSIKTFIDDHSAKPEPSSVIEDPPIIISELPQEPSSSSTRMTSTTLTKVVQPLKSSDSNKREEFENTLNESKLLNVFGYSESETSFNIADNNASFGLVSSMTRTHEKPEAKYENIIFSFFSNS